MEEKKTTDKVALMNTFPVEKKSGEEQMVTLDGVLDLVLPDHGLPVEKIRTLRRRWNDRARKWAEENGTETGHGQKIQHNSTWKNGLPLGIGKAFIEPHLQEAIKKRHKENQRHFEELKSQMIKTLHQVFERKERLNVSFKINCRWLQLDLKYV